LIGGGLRARKDMPFAKFGKAVIAAERKKATRLEGLRARRMPSYPNYPDWGN